MNNLTSQQAIDLMIIQGLIGCDEAQVKANLEHYHKADWAAHLAPLRKYLSNKAVDGNEAEA